MMIQGLTDDEASRQLREGKGNTIPSRHNKPTREIVLENFFSGNNIIMLVVICALYAAFFMFGDRRLLMDSIGIVLVLVVNSVVAIFQELRARALLEKARLMLPHTVRVVRGGVEKEIPQENVVVGDVVVVRRGDFAPVDGKTLTASSLEMDESLLTGESLPIAKREGDNIFSGSYCVSGGGLFLAEKVGGDSLAASITDLARKYKFVTTPLQRNLNRIFIASFTIAVAAVIFEVIVNSGALLTNVDFIRRVAAVILALLPGGLIFFSTVTFAVGVWRVSKLGALVQKLNAIESFSTITTVCMDKTGTLTQNIIAIHAVTPLGGTPVAEAERLLGTYARLCTNPNATVTAMTALPADESAVLTDELAFSSLRKYSAARMQTGGSQRLFVLGAPEFLLEYMDAETAARITGVSDSDALRGYRNVLFGEIAGDTSAASLAEAMVGWQIEPLAMLSLKDPLRDDLDEALALFRKQDIGLKILSGDHPDSVFATVNAAGWKVSREDVLTGAELDALDAPQFDAAVQQNDIFARLSPEHKLKIIRSLNATKGRTAMIGDGVNDVPAIKEAKLGIAMEEGSGMTKEISDIILLKNKFSLLPAIFAEGNNIISTVLLISELYLTKNFVVLIISILRTAGVKFVADFYLTPRRAALISVVGVALPAYCIALWNSRTEPQRRFFTELFTAIATTLAGAGVALFAAEWILYGNFRLHGMACPPCCSVCMSGGGIPLAQVVMLGVVVYVLAVNFVMITLPGNAGNRNKILYAGVGIVALFSAFLWIPSDNYLTRFIHFFYEFSVLPPEMMPVVFGAVALGVVVSWVLRIVLRLLSAR